MNFSGNRIVKQPPGGDCHDLFGAEFKGSPCHHRVLKPPGGGSSDIFGNVEAVEQSPRRVRSKQYLQSSVFAANGVCEPTGTPRSKPGNDSHSRLFGPVESRPQCTPKNRMKSNIPFGLVGAASDPQESAPRDVVHVVFGVARCGLACWFQLGAIRSLAMVSLRVTASSEEV
ncbi:microtubule-associated protein Jupiter-like isoform X8 [Zootermopsis nevadensis]|uniref:microtubule-associated protein Jupiter-like isoform X8 n=1 Tax=Zootermopsis nevadensis TaxID=136037 RepID=UPI000B8ECFBF|nr:microtubule-associated protein Jupiter-like isoform X8 [Zootermopsis nevadensis]